MKIEERIKYLSEWVEYLKGRNFNDLEPTQKQDLIILKETIKDLEVLILFKDFLIDNEISLLSLFSLEEATKIKTQFQEYYKAR